MKKLGFPKISRIEFITVQICYIRKRVWLATSLLVAASLLLFHLYAGENTLNLIKVISSIFPFIALLTITEMAKSASYNMMELEMSCKYSFADIVLARMSILGCFNFCTFILFIFLFAAKNTCFNFLQLVIYLLLPFLCTCLLSLFAINYIPSKDSTYICGVNACLVCSFNSIASTQYWSIFIEERYVTYWLILVMIVIFLLAKEAKRFFKSITVLSAESR